MKDELISSIPANLTNQFTVYLAKIFPPLLLPLLLSNDFVPAD